VKLLKTDDTFGSVVGASDGVRERERPELARKHAAALKALKLREIQRSDLLR
jgi:hypothetical protein